MATFTTPLALLIEELKDLHSAENQLIEALPKMAQAAANSELKQAFETHLTQTQEHAQRLQQIMEDLGESPGKTCKAMEGLVAEGQEVIDSDGDPVVKDLALITAAQKVEHYEIAGYGCARTLAMLVDEEDIADVLQETLDEEGETDKLLTGIAESLEFAGTAAEQESRD